MTTYKLEITEESRNEVFRIFRHLFSPFQPWKFIFREFTILWDSPAETPVIRDWINENLGKTHILIIDSLGMTPEVMVARVLTEAPTINPFKYVVVASRDKYSRRDIKNIENWKIFPGGPMVITGTVNKTIKL